MGTCDTRQWGRGGGPREGLDFLHRMDRRSCGTERLRLPQAQHRSSPSNPSCLLMGQPPKPIGAGTASGRHPIRSLVVCFQPRSGNLVALGRTDFARRMDDKLPPVSPVQPSTSSVVWCSVTIPESQEGNVEVPLTLRLESEGLLAMNTVSILVQVTSKVSWTAMRDHPILASGDSTVVTLDAVNLGNTQINTKITVETPSGLDPPGDRERDPLTVSRRVQISRGLPLPRGRFQGALSRSTYREGHPSRGQPSRYHSKYAPSTPGGLPVIPLVVGLVAVGIEMLVIVITQLRKGRESGTGAHYEEEIQCFLCDMPVVDGGAYACGECGARFHSPGQSKTCDLTQMESCTNCRGVPGTPREGLNQHKSYARGRSP